jgi:MFS transporter, OFA family, oxalate/formate antiporter
VAADASPLRPRIFLGWTVVAVAAAATFSEVAFFNPVLGVFMPALTDEFGWGRTEISGAMTVGSLAGAFVSPIVGPMIDRRGGKLFVAGGCLVMALCLLALSQLQDVWHFYVLYAIGRAVATGMVGLAATVTVSKWFVRRRGLAVGVTTLGTRLGFAVMPIGVQLIISGAGWREAWAVLGFVVLAIGILPVLRFMHARPEDAGLTPDGDQAPLSDASTERVLRQIEVDWSRRDAMRTRAFWLVTAAVSLQAWAGGAVNLHQIPHLVDQGLSPSLAAGVISLSAVFAAAGSLLEGALDERIGSRWTLVIGLVGSAAGMVVLINTDSTLMAIAYAVGYGLAFGLMVTSSQVVFAEYFGRLSLGAIRGSVAPIQMTLNAVGPLVGGAAFDLTGSYLAAFIPFTFAYLLAAGCLVLASKPPHPSPPLLAPVAETAALD